MIKYDAETKTVTMDLVDLEHCGFDHDEYLQEVFLAGLSDTYKSIQWPETLIVKFCGWCGEGGRPNTARSGRGNMSA